MRKLLITLIIVLMSWSCCYALDILDNASVASLGIGKCLYPYNITGVFVNPASLMCIERSQILGSYYSLFTGARYNLLGYGQKYGKINFAGHIVQLYRDGIEVRTSFTADPDQLTYSSKIAGVVSAAGILDMPEITDIMIGGNLKILYYDMYNLQSTIGLGLDLGAYKRNIYVMGSTVNSRFSIDAGISLINLISPVVQMGGATENYPIDCRISSKYNITLLPRYDLKNEQLLYDEISISLDLLTQPVFGIGLGFEYKLMDMLKFRLGYNKDGIAGGMGFEWENISINYALNIKEYGQLHFLDVAYAFGEKPSRKAEELEDYERLEQKADRIYNRVCRQSEEQINKKEYEYPAGMLKKAIPLMPKDEKAKQLLSVCNKAITTTKMSNIFIDYNEAKDILNAFKLLITAVDIDPTHQITGIMLQSFNSKNFNQDLNANAVAKEKQNFISRLNQNISDAITKNDFATAGKEYRKIEVIDTGAENTIRQKREIENAKSNYTDQLIARALQFSKEKNMRSAYICIKEAYKTSNDPGILIQFNAIKDEYKNKNKQSISQELYQKKLYLLTAIAYQDGKIQNEIRNNFLQLKAGDITFENLDLLEEALIQDGIIEKVLP